jgi:hypothetical protein
MAVIAGVCFITEEKGDFRRGKLPHNSGDHFEEWPSLSGCVSSQRRRVISASEKAPDFQN